MVETRSPDLAVPQASGRRGRSQVPGRGV